MPDYYQGRTGMDPFAVIDEFGLDFYEGNVVKYVIRWRRKGGLDDLRKARRYVNELITREQARIESGTPRDAAGIGIRHACGAECQGLDGKPCYTTLMKRGEASEAGALRNVGRTTFHEGGVITRNGDDPVEYWPTGSDETPEETGRRIYMEHLRDGEDSPMVTSLRKAGAALRAHNLDPCAREGCDHLRYEHADAPTFSCMAGPGCPCPMFVAEHLVHGVTTTTHDHE